MTLPSDRVSFFNEAAREAAGRAFAAQSTMGRDRNPEYVAMVTERVGPALNAALEALPPRSKAILALAECSDEELVERAASAVAANYAECRAVLTALGLPVAEQEPAGGKGMSSTDDIATISSDEDSTLGFMLDDGAAPATPTERVALFCELARRQWDLIVDPAKLSPDSGESSPYTWGDEETLIPARDDDEIDSRWFVFTDLDEAVSDA